MRTPLSAGFVFSILTLGSVVSSIAASCLPAPEALVGWWTGDGTADDIVGSNNGTFQGGSAASEAGVARACFSFNGTTAFVQIPDAPVLRPTNLTVEAWVRFNSLDSSGSASAGQQYIVFRQNTRSSYFEGFSLTKQRALGVDNFVFGVSSAAGVGVEVKSLTSVSTGVWYHVAGVRGNNFIQLYVDGQLQGQATVSFPQDYGNFPLFFGSSGQSWWDRKFAGLLDEVSLYDRALTSSEIAALYSAGAAAKCKEVNILSEPGNQVVAQGSTAVFAVSATGLAPLSYQWRFGDAAISGATNTILSLSNVQSADSGIYSVVISNSLGAVTSALAGLTVIVPPSITAQPLSRTNGTGTTASFAVGASGSALGYQWFRDGAGLAGATEASLVLASVTAADAGSYYVVVSNVAGTVTSASAALVVIDPPAITSQPQSRTNNAGTTAVFAVGAVGTDLRYQWLLNGLIIVGATGPTLTLQNVSLADAGSYSVVVSNFAGSVTSNPALLVVIDPPFIYAQPQSLTNTAGTTAIFTVGALGTDLSYQWRKNETTLAGATGTTLIIPNVTEVDAGSYSVMVANSAGSITSIVAVLTVLSPPGIVSNPQSLTIALGQNATFSVGATGSQPLAFQWRFNGGAIGGATGSSYTRTNAQPLNAGEYTVVITNIVGSITSAPASLAFNLLPPIITSVPQSQTVVAGTTMIFEVGAASPTPLSYQWYRNGESLPGQTNSVLTLANTTTNHSGSYVVMVANAAGSVTSAPPAVLTVVPSCSPAPAGLLAWWTGDGTADDIVGSNNGTFQGGSAASEAGVARACFSFNGTTAYVQIPDAPALRPTNLTVEAWVRFNSLDSSGSASAGQQYIVFRQNTRSSYFEGFSLTKQRALGVDNFVFGVSSAAGVGVEVKSLTSVSTGVWYHVAGVRGNNFIQLYVDGQLQGQATVSFPQDYGNFPLFFGSSGQAWWDRKFAGLLDEVSLYDRALTSSEIAALYSAGAAAKCKEVNILSEPGSQVVAQGGPAVFAVSATGLAPLSYQWRFGDAAISGATNTILSLSNVQSADSGIYSVVISNSLGAVTSALAGLTVIVPPSITAQPLSRTNGTGTTASFAVGASGSALGYQWFRGGAGLAGATEASLVLASVTAADAGSYYVVVSNVAGTVTSASAALVVIDPPAITSQPQSRTNNAGTTAVFAVGAVGTDLRYQWLLNGLTIVGATGPTLTLQNVSLADAGSYSVMVGNFAGSVTSNPALLVVIDPPLIYAQPQSRTNNAGTTAVFTVGAVGTDLRYQWLLNGLIIVGATGPTLTLQNVSLANAGSYSVVVSSFAGSVTSNPALLVVIDSPLIYAQPQSLTNAAGTTAIFTVGALGTDLKYQWLLNGLIIVGAAGPTLTLESVSQANVGRYSVVVSNFVGSVTSSPAVLLVVNPPLISTQPRSRTNAAGTTAIFTVGALGTDLKYQWRKNETALAGATGSNLTLFNVQPAHAGTYLVVVTNLAASVTSAVAVLTVTTSAAPVTAVLGPLLAGMTTTNGYVLVECDSISALTVNYGTTTNYDSSATTAFALPTGNGTYVHRIKLTGLTANTLYNYQVDGTTTPATNYTFRTLVNSGTGFRFAWASDSILALGSPGPAIHGPIANRILNIDRPLIFLWGGDGCMSGDYAGWHNEFFIPEQNSQNRYIPMYPTVGNHEGWTTLTKAYYQVPDSTGTNGYYSFDCGDVHFTVGNFEAPAPGGTEGPNYAYGSAQYNWISNDVRTTTKPWKIFYNHAPAYTWAAVGYPADPVWQMVTSNLLEPSGVQVFLSGHKHYYQHNLVNGMHHIIVGGDGAPLYDPLSPPDAHTLQSAKDNCYLVADTTPTTLHMVVYNDHGTVLDTIDLTNAAPPIIEMLSPDQVVQPGQSAVFGFTASGTPPLVYRWRFNGVDLTDGGQITGATTATLTIANVQEANVGSYMVVVSNASGSVTSAVTVLNLPRLCATPPAGLAGWWTGNGNPNDIVGGHHGTLQGGATASVPGKVGHAFSFDGTNSFVQIPDSTDLHPATLTVETWVRFDAYQSPGSSASTNQQYIVFKQNSQSSEFAGFALTKDLGPHGHVILWEVASASGQLARIASVTTVVTNTWYHLAGVRGSNYVQLYLNGQLEAQSEVNSPQDYGNQPLYFATSGQAYYDRKLQGALDEVSLYSRALSAAEIGTLYSASSAGKCRTTPVRLRDAVLRDGQLSFILEGELGRSYAIEVSTDLKHWSYWKDCTQSENALQINSPAVQTRQFYRAKPLP